MLAKDYLNKLTILEANAEMMIRRIDEHRAMTTNVCSKMSMTPHGPSPDLQPVQTLIAHIVDLEETANSAVDKYVDYKNQVYVTLEGIDKPIYRQLIEYRYILRLRWKDIATRLKYSIPGVKNMHEKALQKLDEILAEKNM